MKSDIELDQIALRILRLLQEDATISVVELADRVGASSASCWRRIKAMEAAGYFKKTVRLVDPARLGRSVNVLCNVRMKSHDPTVRLPFETYVQRQPEIVEVFSMSGDWDYLLRVVAEDVQGYNAFLMQKLLTHPSVAAASSHFALEMVKYSTAIPVVTSIPK